MALGRKTGGRQKGARNRATAEARAAAEATGILPLDYMLSVMRDPNADPRRRDAMAIAAAPYLHSKLSAVEAKPNEPSTAEMCGIRVEFVRPRPRDEDDEDAKRTLPRKAGIALAHTSDRDPSPLFAAS
jgi:hypothetical protein